MDDVAAPTAVVRRTRALAVASTLALIVLGLAWELWLAPTGRGTLAIKSRDPKEPAAMQPNYLSAEIDRRTAVAGMKVARALAATPAMRRLTTRWH